MPTRSSFAAAVAVACALAARPAAAETVNCTPIAALPATITTPGIYCFTQTLTTNITSGVAVFIQANNVVLDLNGYRLVDQGGKVTSAIGIAAVNGQDITVKNGTVRGFRTGIQFFDNGASQGNVVEDIRADRNTITGIDVTGRGTLIRRNQVIGTGGGTCCGTGVAAVGITASGAGPRVIDNDVSDVKSPGDVASRGIRFGFSTVGGLALGNRITNADTAIDFDIGTGKYRDNLTFDAPGFLGGTDAGGNS